MSHVSSSVWVMTAGSSIAHAWLVALVVVMVFSSNAVSGSEGCLDRPAVPRSGCSDGPRSPARADSLPPSFSAGVESGDGPVPMVPAPTAGPSEPRLLARVNFRNLGGHVIIPVRVNGSRVLDMVLDTGMSAPIVLLSRLHLAEELALGVGQPVMIGGAGGEAPKQGSYFPGVAVSIGELEMKDQTMIAVGEDGVPTPCIHDGVIGKSIFDRYLVEIDFESSLLSIHDGAIPDSQGFLGLPLEFNMGIPMTTAGIRIDDRPEVPVTLVLDLGARHTVSIHASEAKGIVAPQKSLAAVVGRGMQGEVSGTIGRLRALRVGPFAFSGVISSFTDPATGVSCAPHGLVADGNLGVEILNRFRVVLDYPHRRILLKPNSRFDNPFDYNMAGFSLERQRNGSYLVRSVVERSPGTDAGIRRGDLIVGIDGQDLAAGSAIDYTGRFLTDGTSLSITVERDGARFDRILELRRLI